MQDAVENIEKAIKEKLFNREQNKRKSCETYQTINKMISSLSEEITNLEMQDSRIPILESIKNSFKVQLEEFCVQRLTEKQLQLNSVKILINNLSGSSLHRLSQHEKEGLMNFILRNLWAPIQYLIEKCQDSQFNPSFFSAPTEKRIGQAAQLFYKEITALLNNEQENLAL